MNKKRISLVFSLLFLTFLIAPTVIVIVDDSIDVSIFYVTSEEEEEKCIEKHFDSEVLFLDYTDIDLFFVSKFLKNSTTRYIKKYKKLHLNLISPPPDFS